MPHLRTTIGGDGPIIDYFLVRSLGLNSDETASIQSSALGTDPVDAPIYEVKMSFGSLHGPARPEWQNVRPVGVSVIARGVLALIGRDMLGTCVLIYDGFKAELLISY